MTDFLKLAVPKRIKSSSKFREMPKMGSTIKFTWSKNRDPSLVTHISIEEILEQIILPT